MEYLLGVRKRVLERLTSTRAMAAVLSGSVERSAYARYLTNVYHYARHSSTVIAMAGARCVDGHPKLADYLLRHAQEELGHDEWALADLADLGMDAEAVRATRPTPSCAAMIGYEYFVAGHANPVGLFGWLYVLEAMGDDLGEKVARRLDESLGLSGKGLRFLAGHGRADHDHTADLTHQIAANVCSAGDRADIHHVADVVAELYVRMFEEVTQR
jgi:heme oxygenase